MPKRTSYETGSEGELLVLDRLHSRGIHAEQGDPNDINTNKYVIEVKTANRTRYRRDRPEAWQFLLHKKGHNELGFSDFIVLVLNTEPHRFYVIPHDALRGKHKVTIPSENYQGKYAKYLGAWALIDG